MFEKKKTARARHRTHWGTTPDGDGAVDVGAGVRKKQNQERNDREKRRCDRERKKKGLPTIRYTTRTLTRCPQPRT